MQPALGKPFHRATGFTKRKVRRWRNALDHTERFRELANAIAALKAPTLVLDGEVCVFDKNLISQIRLGWADSLFLASKFSDLRREFRYTPSSLPLVIVAGRRCLAPARSGCRSCLQEPPFFIYGPVR